jgi:hypothetical protein
MRFRPGNHPGRNLIQPNLQQKISHNLIVLSLTC